MTILNSALRAATDAYRNPTGSASAPRAAVPGATPPVVPGAAQPAVPASRPVAAVTAHPSEGWTPSGDWKQYAECGPGDTELFFSKDPMEKKAALAICHDCPVARECLAEAMAQERGADLHGRFGIRGGTTPVQRRDLSRTAKLRPADARRGRPQTSS